MFVLRGESAFFHFSLTFRVWRSLLSMSCRFRMATARITAFQAQGGHGDYGQTGEGPGIGGSGPGISGGRFPGGEARKTEWTGSRWPETGASPTAAPPSRNGGEPKVGGPSSCLAWLYRCRLADDQARVRPLAAAAHHRAADRRAGPGHRRDHDQGTHAPRPAIAQTQHRKSRSSGSRSG